MLTPRPKYREDKATEAAARFLERAGGKMEYMKLLKLLYMMDRKALIQFRMPVTFDRYYSLNNGPILSATKDIMLEPPTEEAGAVWAEHISPAAGYTVHLIKATDELNPLSDAEIELIDEVYDEFAEKNMWDLVKLTHTLPEWHFPNGGAIPFDFRDILLGEGMGGDEILAIEEEIKSTARLEQHLG